MPAFALRIGTLAATASLVLGYTIERDRVQLAANVLDEEAAAPRGVAWVQTLFQTFRSLPLDRLRFVDSIELPGDPRPVARVFVEYPYRDAHGNPATGKAKLYLPATLAEKQAKLPLYYSAGYELDEASAVAHVGRGFVVVNPRELEVNPLVRTLNPDIALVHIARALPFVDDARVVIGGLSAGGHATLLLAGETFPLAGAAADLPPVNWGYNVAYFLQRNRPAVAGQPTTPQLDGLLPVIRQMVAVYGDDPDDVIYYRHSPLAHFDTITCPVSAFWSTADTLVPINQIGPQWIRPHDVTTFPPGFTFDPERLMKSPDGRRRLVDVLKDEDYEATVIPEATAREQLASALESGTSPELPATGTRRWSITIVDEGPPEPLLGHVKRGPLWSQKKFVLRAIGGKIAAGQLTAKKLERLMDRYAGIEWLPAGSFKHLDAPEIERSDVLRGLTTYVAAGPENARAFAELYGKLSRDKRVLPPDVVQGLSK